MWPSDRLVGWSGWAAEWKAASHSTAAAAAAAAPAHDHHSEHTSEEGQGRKHGKENETNATRKPLTHGDTPVVTQPLHVTDRVRRDRFSPRQNKKEIRERIHKPE